jgi:hypothetical protein
MIRNVAKESERAIANVPLGGSCNVRVCCKGAFVLRWRTRIKRWSCAGGV